jgi:Flp pilus assembly protein TadG
MKHWRFNSKLIEIVGFIKRDKGSVLILTVLFLPVIFGFAAFAVDGGVIMMAKNQLQTAADASALAGGSGLVVDTWNENIVRERAEQYAGLNKCLGEPVTHVSVTVNYPRTTVDATSTVNMFFARLLGIYTVTLSAHSASEVGSLSGIPGMSPWAIPSFPYKPGDPVVLKTGDKYKPNFYFAVQLPPVNRGTPMGGGSNYKQNIISPPQDYI